VSKGLRILCLADLHRLESDRAAVAEQDRWLAGLLAATAPDAVLIAGDVFDEQSEAHPYRELARVFSPVPVVAVLGNHEFIGRTVEQVLNRYRLLYDPATWNVHYLDIIGSHRIGDVQFFGNVLWYDGSLATVPGQDLLDFAGHTWRDGEIREFDPVRECQRCAQTITDCAAEPDTVRVLCTHCVPHPALNAHMSKPSSPYNAFSGVTWLLDRVKPDYAVCGHTHRPVHDVQINGVRCWNVGSDYTPPFRHVVLTLDGQGGSAP